MKSIKFFLVAILIASASFLHAQSVSINPAISTIDWLGKKVTGQHNGKVKLKSGTLTLKDGKVTGEFIMDMTTITVEDIQGEYADKLLGHLKSDDFFSVDKHKESKFVITSSKSLGKNQYEIAGSLTIKGITNTITFPATIVNDSDGFMAKADFKVDRTKFDIKYGSGSFFDNLGDKTIYDDIEFSVNLKK